MKKLALVLGCGATLSLATVQSQAAMYQQWNQDAAGLGDAQSGSAASAQDASTEIYNPAGLIMIKQQQAVFGANINMPTFKFDGSSTFEGQPSGSENAKGGKYFLSPFLHYAAPISNTWAFGFGISSGYNAQSDWGGDNSVSPVATDTQINTYQISTDLAYAPWKPFSLGAGFDFVRVMLESYDYDSPTSSPYDSNLNGDSWDTAWHAGALFQINEATRIGAAYHSKVNYKAVGDASTTSQDGDTLEETDNFGFSSVLPAYSTLSAYRQINPKWVMQASVSYTQWDQINEITFDNLPTSTGLEDASQECDYQNTWRGAVGAHYAISPTLMMRFGLAYETSPYNNDDVYLQAPPGNSYDASIGLHVVTSTEWAFDFGWTHIFYEDLNVDTTNDANDATSTGDFSGSSDIIGLQAVWNMQ